MTGEDGFLMRRHMPTQIALMTVGALALAGAALGGCSMLGGGGVKPDTTAATGTSVTGADGTQIDVRRYLGPNYCPELRVPEGMQVVRQYEKGHDGDRNFVVWQASLGKTARECLYDLQGGLTLRVGVSGRVIAGPKGGASTVSVPLKVAVVKHQEAVLSAQDYQIAVTIPPQGSAVFTEVKDILVPSPGQKRDYILYVGFASSDWDPMHPVQVAAPAVEEGPLPDEVQFEPPPEEPPPPPKPATPKELPTPKGLIPGL